MKIYTAIALAAVAFLSTLKAQAADIAVISYNTGLLRMHAVNLVPCASERVAPQVHMVINELTRTPRRDTAVLLQEVWTKRGFETYRDQARARGLNIVPTTFEEIKDNGQMTITNMKIKSHRFMPFKEDKMVKRGLRIAFVEASDSRHAFLVNTHMTYSDSKEFSDLHRAHFAETEEFLSTLDRRSNFPIVIAGDFNAGSNLTFKKQVYNPRTTIWNESLSPMMNRLGFTAAPIDAFTWDESQNSLVNNPALPIKLINGLMYGTWRWEENDSNLDHIFASRGATISDGSILFTDRVRLPNSCQGRRDESGRTQLSDHYGIRARVRI